MIDCLIDNAILIQNHLANHPQVHIEMINIGGYIAVRIRYKISKGVKEFKNNKLNYNAHKCDHQIPSAYFILENKLPEWRGCSCSIYKGANAATS